MSNYFPLHVHTHYSLMDGLSKPSHVVKRCKELNLAGSAMTDHGNIAGAIAFSDVMNKAGLKPIIGVEFYVAHEVAALKSNRKLTHLLVIAKNEQGWRQLIKLTSKANDPDNFYYKPRLSLAEISEFCDGNLIGISGHIGSCICDCVFSDVNEAANAQSPEAAGKLVKSTYLEDTERKAREFERCFGEGNFFLEIQLIDKDRMPAAQVLADILRDVSKRTDIPCVATPDAHYCKREDAIDQRVLLCNALDITLKEVKTKMVRGEDVALGGFFKSNSYHIPSYDEMIKCGCTEEELENTNRIADMCEAYELTARPTLPIYNDVTQPTQDKGLEIKSGLSSAELLRQRCREGWKYRKKNIDRVIATTAYTQQDYIDRIEAELQVLEGVQFENGSCLSDYFLIVQDIVMYAINNGQLVGAGRGSAAGSLVLYLLGVTHIDPIEYDLMFERFYNAGRNTADRVSLPDVDMDFQITKRADIIDYIRNRFGKEKVAQMLTFTRMQGRSALKDVLRAWSACSYTEMNQITKFIPDEAEISADHERGRQGSWWRWRGVHHHVGTRT
jgi:DNA polymerase-3 subunit alpha